MTRRRRDWVACAIVAARVVFGKYMTCGSGVSLCGVLALESGLGEGFYAHDEPTVHGLWPNVAPYGDSECVAPRVSEANPTQVYECYDESGSNTSKIVSFETHE
ncbi:hypothetical protein CTAYLR_000161 [Chrysophaeum taylorii]|uniref:Uncharacterized protein n=1 Tax=Chrysophaeum taylorii TaxID=2483200 RepID=A0AAD7UHJ8_9STRA|nr:hypothetical protein CTAYLR_000161 [Chrysophaeum taylorii]